MNADLLLFLRFGIATIACAVAYSAQLLLFFRLGGALCAETAVPHGPVDAAHRQARYRFCACAALIELAVVALGFAMHSVMSAVTWADCGFPIAVGASFAMLYSLGTRTDRATLIAATAG